MSKNPGFPKCSLTAVQYDDSSLLWFPCLRQKNLIALSVKRTQLTQQILKRRINFLNLLKIQHLHIQMIALDC